MKEKKTPPRRLASTNPPPCFIASIHVCLRILSALACLTPFPGVRGMLSAASRRLIVRAAFLLCSLPRTHAPCPGDRATPLVLAFPAVFLGNFDILLGDCFEDAFYKEVETLFDKSRILQISCIEKRYQKRTRSGTRRRTKPPMLALWTKKQVQNPCPRYGRERDQERSATTATTTSVVQKWGRFITATKRTHTNTIAYRECGSRSSRRRKKN